MIRTVDAPVVADMLLEAATTVSTGNPVTGRPAKKTFESTLVGAGASVTVVIEGSNTGVGWTNIGTIALTSAAPADGFYFDGPWSQVRARVSAISGTGASVSCAMGS